MGLGRDGLEVALAPGYSPQFGDELEFLSTASILNGFASANPPELGDGLLWDPDVVDDGLLLVLLALTVQPERLEFGPGVS